VLKQQVEEGAGARGVLRVPKDVGVGREVLGPFQRLGVEVALMGEKGLLLLDCRLDGGERRAQLIPDRVGEGDLPHLTLLHVSAGTSLLEDEADAPVHVRIGRPVAGIGVVVHFLGEVGRADLVERRLPVFRKPLRELRVDPIGHELIPRVLRLGRLEKVGAVGPHFVVVGHHVGPPPVIEVDPIPALDLRERKPVAVQVEPVVVGPPAGPDLVVLAVEGIGHQGIALVHVGPVGVPVAPVRIQDRLDQEDALLKILLDLRPLPGHEVVGLQHRHFAGGGLVAVHAVAELHDDRLVPHVLDRRGRVADAQVLLAQLVEVLVVLRRGDDRVDHRPELVGLPDLRDRDAVRLARQFVEVGHQASVPRVVAPDVPLQKFGRRRNVRVQLHVVGKEVVGLGVTRPRHAKKQTGNQREGKASPPVRQWKRERVKGEKRHENDPD
jgi:hypothetical protein